MLEPTRVSENSDTGFHGSLPWEIVVHDYPSSERLSMSTINFRRREYRYVDHLARRMLVAPEGSFLARY